MTAFKPNFDQFMGMINDIFPCFLSIRLVEQNTDDILNNPAEKCDKNKHKSQEDVEETVSKRKFSVRFLSIHCQSRLTVMENSHGLFCLSLNSVLQKAGNHMEHTFLASYVCLLIGNLIMECKQHEMEVRKILRNQSFKDMYQILDKYHNFLNLTASVSTFQRLFWLFVLIKRVRLWHNFISFCSPKRFTLTIWKRRCASFNSWKRVIQIQAVPMWPESMSDNIQHRHQPIQFIPHRCRTHTRAHQVKIVGPVTAIQIQVALATACSINFTFQVDK